MTAQLIRNVTSDSLLMSRQKRVAAGLPTTEMQYAWERGFHVYGKLRLNLALSASEDTANAKRYLRIVQTYADIASRCAETCDALLLEVQGEVIHLLLRGEHDAKAVDDMLEFCISFADAVYQEIEPLAGDAWQSFVMATEHGQAVLISNGNGSSDSIVSLGPAANNPAKALPQTPAGNLSIRPDTLAIVYPQVDRRKAWEQFDLRNPQYQPASDDAQRLQAYSVNRASMLSEAKVIARHRAASDPQITILSAADIVPETGIDVSEPVKVQGFYMRADLDGFTADVKEAFEDSTGAKVREIVTRFSAFMAFADHFVQGLKSGGREVIRLPWAGDCANMVLLPRANRTYDGERASVPATEPAKWHDMTSGTDADGRAWRDYLLKSEWAVACAGGDRQGEGANGYLLVAHIEAKDRRFRIAAGWGSRRSNDALATDGVDGGDTVVHGVDYIKLSPHLQRWFKELNSIFYRGKDLSMRRIAAAAIEEESKATAATVATGVAGVNIRVPPPRPHYRWR